MFQSKPYQPYQNDAEVFGQLNSGFKRVITWKNINQKNH